MLSSILDGLVVDKTVDALGRPLATSKKTMFGAKIHDRSDAKLKDNDKGNEKEKENDKDKIRSEENSLEPKYRILLPST